MIKILCLLGLSILATGCAFSTMSPAHKLEPGEVVLQGAVDAPGFLYIPRISGAVTAGVGGIGDVGAHLGTTVANINAGGTLRGYVARELAVSLQGDVFLTTFRDSLFSPGHLGVVTITPRFGRILADASDRVYGGFQSTVLIPINVQGSVSQTNRLVVGAGGYVGIGFDSVGDFDWQVELAASPVGFADVNQTGYELTPLPIAQVGIGVQYRRERERPRPEPSVPAPAATPGREPIL